MAQPKLTRSPALTYTWMVISVVVVIILFRRWDAIATGKQLRDWWLILGGFLWLSLSTLRELSGKAPAKK